MPIGRLRKPEHRDVATEVGTRQGALYTTGDDNPLPIVLVWVVQDRRTKKLSAGISTEPTSSCCPPNCRSGEDTCGVDVLNPIEAFTTGPSYSGSAIAEERMSCGPCRWGVSHVIRVFGWALKIYDSQALLSTDSPRVLCITILHRNVPL